MPGDLDARSVICRVWVRQGRLDEAEEMLREMEDSLASLSRVYASLGDVCLKKGMEESAQTYYRKFMSLNPGAPLAVGIAERLKGIEATRRPIRKGTQGTPRRSRPISRR